MTKTTENKTKKRLIISYHNLSEELQEKLRQQYPNGYTESMIRIDKGQGNFFYAVVLETEDINYLVKVDVKIDDIEDEDEKDYFDDPEIGGADEIMDTADEEQSEELENVCPPQASGIQILHRQKKFRRFFH